MEDWFERKGSVRTDSAEFEKDESLPRRISNIIPTLHNNRKIFVFLMHLTAILQSC
jgi:neutral ceramidase